MKKATLLRKCRGINPGALLLTNDESCGYRLTIYKSVSEDGERLHTAWGVSEGANYTVVEASIHVSNIISIKVLKNPKQ